MQQQSLSSILSNVRVGSEGVPDTGRISILKRPTADPTDETSDDDTGTSAPSTEAASRVGTTSSATTKSNPSSSPTPPAVSGTRSSSATLNSTTPSTSAPSSSSSSSPAPAPTSKACASQAAASASAAQAEPSLEELSNQNRRRKEILKAEMNWRKECEALGGDFTRNPDWGLMEGEWLQSIPADFEKKWIVVPCPVGKRCSLWALDGETHAYTKQGMFLESFESSLPNGFHYSNSNGSTFLDTVYCENLSTFFAIDVLQWDDYDLRRGSAEYRLYDLNGRLAEQMSSQEPPPAIRARFKKFVMQLPLFPCTASGVARALTWSPLPNLKLELDGILFYHHDAMYTPGTTPLVAWIKPWMAPEIFPNVRVPPHLLSRKPCLYKDRATFMKEWDAKEARQRAKREKKAGRKSSDRGVSTPISPSSAATSKDQKEKKEEEEDDEALPQIEDDPAWTVAAGAAKRSDNSLLALIGDNIADTLGGLSLNQQP